MNRMRPFLLLLGCLLFAVSANAQYELKASNFNGLYRNGPPAGGNQALLPATLNSNYQGAGSVSGTSGPLDATPNDAAVPGTIATAHADRYPSTANKAIVLTRSTIGGNFTSGVPRYFMGDVMTAPLVKADGVTPAPAGYWRGKPVGPGESLNPFITAGAVTVNTSSISSPTVTVASVPASLVTGATLLGRTVSSISGTTLTLSGFANLTISAATSVSFGSIPSTLTPIPLGSVTVTQSNSTNGTQVTVASVPAELIVGATILGQPITAVTGTNVTLAGLANQTITSATAVPIIPAVSYYYSPHAEKVYASQPGRVTVLWETLNPTENGGYETTQEIFSVSSNTSVPVHTIFWTEGSFDGPKVPINDGRVTTVNPAYYTSVPKAVAQEVNIPGYVPQTSNLTTLSFDRYSGVGQLHAYNVEGRIFVEYLGNLRLAGNIYESVGFDVVDIVRAPTVTYSSVNLGRQLMPHDGDLLLKAAPVLTNVQNTAAFYGTNIQADGTAAYFAERETSGANNPDDGSPSSPDAFNKVVFYWTETGSFSIQWPKFQDRYWQRWSPNLADYAHYTVDAAGSTPVTGIPFIGGALPQIIFQDDPAQIEAKIDLITQRLFVTFSGTSDKRNRSLLKFNGSSGAKVWYVNLYTQTDDRKTVLGSTTDGTTTTVTVSSTAGLEVGMIVTGAGIAGAASIVSITDSTHLVLSQMVAAGTNPLAYTVESDGAAQITTTATVGTRLIPPAGHENAGYIASGTGYYPAGYLNPFETGVAAANLGAIIPVNALPTDNVLNVRWFKKVSAPSAEFDDLYVPGKIGRYTVSYPATTTPQIVLAEGVGTNDLLGEEAAGSVYYQNSPGLPGYNPNEEHAVLLGGRAYALREDLNVTAPAGYTSQPFVLLAYTNATDHRPAIHAYKVIRQLDLNGNGIKDAGDIFFDYTATAGTLLVKPYPLPLLPLALVGAGAARTAKDIEIIGADNPLNLTVASDDAYKGFTFKDRNGFTWVHRGPHSTGSPTLTMKLYYLSQAGFFVPGVGVPAVGTVLPYLRNPARSGQTLSLTAIDNGLADQPLPIIYRPAWPANPPELRVGETLTLPKFGLPQVRGQSSAQVFYQQSLATAATATLLTKNSVTLHDPTREKSISLTMANLSKLPAAIKTTNSDGKLYFQTLPPHLQSRLYFDPARGIKGAVVFAGTFHDEIAGEDYLDLNVLTAAEQVLVKNLVPALAADKAKWDAAIDALSTRVETFKSNLAQFGSFIVDTTKNQDFGVNSLAVPQSPDTAVDSYAVTATGQGTGFVTMVFANGSAFTDEGDPVSVEIFKIASLLYTGDLKAIASSNPLDEQVTLRHSGDFAGKPEDYDFEWRWATGESSAPSTYATVMTKRIGDPAASTQNWVVVRDPGTLIASAAQLTAAGAPLPFPRTENVHPVTYLLDVQGQPTSTIIPATSYTDAEIAAGYPSLFLRSSVGVNFTGGIPGSIVFSANLGDLDGFVLYVNGKVALASNAPTPRFTLSNASADLTNAGLSQQFNVSPSYFTAGPNIVEVAIYTQADPNSLSTLNFLLEAAQETDLVVSGSTWQTPSDPEGKNTNTALVGGSPTNPFGGPQFVLNDRWFTMRYRPKASANNVLGTPYSRWMPPQFVEGWIKRVLAAINPFEQRVKDLATNAVSTDVSVVTQAGTRWEGDIALNLSNINDVGLIAIYETVLNRAKSISIDANTNDPDTNNALILAAGYLNDLYTLLGNEAYADAANPTISLDDQTTVTEVNTSRFSFEGQVASSLDEELALLRGRDDSFSPGVAIAPAYNRLYWNYTHGINSGEVIYAINYNIKEKVGSTTANGVIDESDAQRMFPQGHGDAYGHYLTALTGYYRLLTNANFTWTPRAEAVTVLGQPITVDFQDERKFASAASYLARTAGQIVALAYRQSYKDDPANGWSHYRDSKSANTQTGITSRQGLDEWTSRGTQGALFNWAVGNALLPDVDTYHSGVEKIDRTTVPELAELASAATTFQTTIDNADAYLNPLGLSPGSIAFDISPAELQAGHSHYEQVYARALGTLTNAKGSFDQAARMTRLLRTQENQIDDEQQAIEEQERSYVSQLIEIYGQPYAGDIGPGKTYVQDYSGPDLKRWFIIDRPTYLVDTTKTVLVTMRVPKNVRGFTGNAIADVTDSYNLLDTQETLLWITPNQWVQFADVIGPGPLLGHRPELGALQQALLDSHLAQISLLSANNDLKVLQARFTRQAQVFTDLISNRRDALSKQKDAQTLITGLNAAASVLNNIRAALAAQAESVVQVAAAVAEALPTDAGLSTDVTAPARSAIKVSAAVPATGIRVLSVALQISAKVLEAAAGKFFTDLQNTLEKMDIDRAELQNAYEFEQLYRELLSQHYHFAELTGAYQAANTKLVNLQAAGNSILSEREIFRQRAAVIIQGYRTKDLGFRLFRNEALEQYRTLFDLASRYTYLAAKSYDYETGLLGSTAGQSVFAKIVASRSLGDLTGGVPQSTTSTLGDAGLAGTLAKLNADFSVAKGRLGINNPDKNGTVFSLRSELYRLLNDPTITSDDDAWQQTLEQHIVANVMTDADVATFCRNIKKPDGTPVPGIIIPFSTTIQHGKNFFGIDLAAGDHAYTPSNFATKIYNVGIALPGYVGMDTFATGNIGAGAPNTSAANALSATPYVYLIPCGNDYMLAPPLGDTNVVRSWTVNDQALPLPYNLGATSFNSTQFFNANGTLSEQPWILRKHQAFRPVNDPAFFYSTVPAEFTNSRLVGRSVWNNKWKLVIPAYTLLKDEQDGLDRFAASVKDILLFLRTYSNSGN